MRRAIVLLALASCHAPVAAAPTTPAPPRMRVVDPVRDPECERVDVPPVRGAVIAPAPEETGPALVPVVRAACACSRSGERLELTATIWPEAGKVSAVAPEDFAEDACLQRALKGVFAPFDVGSDLLDPRASAHEATARITVRLVLVHP